MSLEFVREVIRVSQVIGEDSTQTVVENDIIVPDVKPDIAQILLLDGDVYTNKSEAMHDKILVNGVIQFKILYIPDDADRTLKSINSSAPFSYSLEIPGTRQGMSCSTVCDIEHIEYEILNGRKINVKTVLKVGGRSSEGVDREIIEGIRGLEDIQELKESIRVNSYIGSNETEYTVREAMEVPSEKPAIKEILRSDIKITGKDFKVTDNKIVAKGELNISTLYLGDDENRSIQVMEHEIPFTQFIDLAGVDEDSTCEVDFKIIGSQFEAGEDNDGELRMLNGEVVLGIRAEGYSKKGLETISDAYSPRTRLSFEKDNLSTDETVAKTTSQVILKDTLAIREGDPEIGEVFNVICKPVLNECTINDEKVTVEGFTRNSVLYLSGDSEQPVCCHTEEIPFRHTVDVKGVNPEMPCEANLEVEHCNYSMISGTEVEIRLVMSLGIKVIDQVTIPLIVKVSENSVEDKRFLNQPSITIYFAKPGDTLWKIAKRYLTTVGEIQTVNALSESDNITPGQQVIIPKKVV